MAELIHVVATEGAALELQQGAASVIEFKHPYTISDPWAVVAEARMQWRSVPGGTLMFDTVSTANDAPLIWTLYSDGRGEVIVPTADTKDLAEQQLRFDIRLIHVNAEWNFAIRGTVDITGTITRTDDTEYQLADPTRQAALYLCLNNTRENIIDTIGLCKGATLASNVAGGATWFFASDVDDSVSIGDKIGIVLDATSGGFKTTHETTIDNIIGSSPKTISVVDAFPDDDPDIIATSGNVLYYVHVGELPLS